MHQLKLHADPDTGPFISAHRGFSAAAPENTLPALEAALAAGAHVAEIDVKLTKDGQLVLMHDDDVERTTDGDGRVCDLTLAEIAKLDAGAWFDRKFARTRVPTLDDVLAWSRGRLGLLIELKDYPERDPRFVPALIAAIERNNAAGFAIPAGFDHCTMAALHRLRPAWTLEMILHCRLADTVHAARAAGCTLVSLEPQFTVAEDIPAMHQAGLSVLTTVTSVAHGRELHAMGVDFFEADDVDLARAALEACREEMTMVAPHPVATGPMDRAKIDERGIALRFLAAQAIAREAGRLALRFRAAPDSLDIALKGPQDFVTEADRAVERLICGALRAAFPEDAIIGEEYGASGALAEADVIWAIDPIDGTANFAAGRPDWCVSIGAIVAGQPEIGVIHLPVLDDLYAARRGQGAVRNGVPLAVRACNALSEATVCLEYSVGTPIDRYLEIVEGVLRSGGEYRRNGSAAVSLAQIAAGTLDGFLELSINVYDVLAGIVLVNEAGGWTSDFLGGAHPLTEGNRLIAAAPGIRAELLQAAGLPDA